ncbi:hypothetical protein HMPREF9130_1091 [Peptoniphilus sp. oral taxon 375 str. F0436]|nr:hypothetical protein HMPREF9130_1091 [Peptoniphilus sp. oral taxon 375 str. F0436]
MELRREKIKDQVAKKVKEKIETRTYNIERGLCVFHFGKDFGAESYEKELLKTRKI